MLWCFNLGLKARKWINRHLTELRSRYPNETVIVCEGKIVESMDEPLDPIEINEVARKLCGGKDWSYTYVSEEEYVL